MNNFGVDFIYLMTALQGRHTHGFWLSNLFGMVVYRVGGRRPKLTDEQWEQAGRMIAAGEARQRVAIIYDVGVSTFYRKFPVGR